MLSISRAITVTSNKWAEGQPSLRDGARLESVFFIRSLLLSADPSTEGSATLSFDPSGPAGHQAVCRKHTDV